MDENVASNLYNLLVQQGVYGKVCNVDRGIFESFASNNGFNTLDLFCPKCKQDKTFVYIQWDFVEGLGSYKVSNMNRQLLRTLVYVCPTCGTKLFYLFYYDGSDIIKLAQFPSQYDVSRDELKKYQKNDLINKDSFDELYKAEICASSGFYVAAYTYMRRVYEKMLLSVFENNQDDIGISDEEFKKLHSDKKLEAIKTHLAIDDEIYLPLYGLLSAGIHAMSEEKCCEDYSLLKPILIDILAEQKAKKEKSNKRKELKDLFSKRKSEMK